MTKLNRKLLDFATTETLNRQFAGFMVDIEDNLYYQALKRIEALEAALTPFAKYHELSLRGRRLDDLVVGTYSYNTQGEPDAIDLETRHFRKAATLLNKK